MSLVDTKERIFRDGQIYSRPRFGGPVGSLDTRQFTPDPNPYGVEREPGIGVDPSKLDMTPYIKPGVPMPPATEEDVQRYKFLMGPRSPLAGNFLDAFMSDRGLLEQNKEVMGPKEQVYPRFADPNDGTLKNPMMVAADPVDKAAYGPQMTRSQFSDYNELRSPGYKDRRDALRMRLMNAGILPRV